MYSSLNFILVPPRLGPTKKPHDSLVVRPHCLGARLRWRAPAVTVEESADERNPCYNTVRVARENASIERSIRRAVFAAVAAGLVLTLAASTNPRGRHASVRPASRTAAGGVDLAGVV